MATIRTLPLWFNPVRTDGTAVAIGRAAIDRGATDQMPFPDTSFDAIFSSGVIHVWPGPAPALHDLRRGRLSVHSRIDPRRRRLDAPIEPHVPIAGKGRKPYRLSVRETFLTAPSSHRPRTAVRR
ncbi:MAG: methyltransferase domain-containing protein [Alphaproteobacteria bacterium]|nr:methyltransferase domain-containing protein [Alphaproteobacteria bacterium]